MHHFIAFMKSLQRHRAIATVKLTGKMGLEIVGVTD